MLNNQQGLWIRMNYNNIPTEDKKTEHETKLYGL